MTPDTVYVVVQAGPPPQLIYLGALLACFIVTSAALAFYQMGKKK